MLWTHFGALGVEPFCHQDVIHTIRKTWIWPPMSLSSCLCPTQIHFSTIDLELHARFTPGANESVFDRDAKVAARTQVWQHLNSPLLGPMDPVCVRRRRSLQNYHSQQVPTYPCLTSLHDPPVLPLYRQVMPPFPDDRFLCSFSHIFAGGYSAGYFR